MNARAGARSAAVVRPVAAALGIPRHAILEIGRNGTARELAARAVRDRVPVVVTVGGDGTIHQVIQEIAGTTTALGIVPSGTSNDLARDLGVPQDLDAVLTTLSQGHRTSVDLLRMGRTRIATAGGLALPAMIARRCNELRAGRHRLWAVRLGPAIYSLVAAHQICRGTLPVADYVVRAGQGTPRRHRGSAVLFSRIPTFGGGLQLVPKGTLSPGAFAALVITACTRRALLDTLLRLRRGKRLGRNAVVYNNLRRLDLRSDALVGAFGDGEWLRLRYRTRITVEPAALQVLAPDSPRTVLPATLEEAV